MASDQCCRRRTVARCSRSRSTIGRRRSDGPTALIALTVRASRGPILLPKTLLDNRLKSSSVIGCCPDIDWALPLLKGWTVVLLTCDYTFTNTILSRDSVNKNTKGAVWSTKANLLPPSSSPQCRTMWLRNQRHILHPFRGA